MRLDNILLSSHYFVLARINLHLDKEEKALMQNNRFLSYFVQHLPFIKSGSEQAPKNIFSQIKFFVIGLPLQCHKIFLIEKDEYRKSRLSFCSYLKLWVEAPLRYHQILIKTSF